MEIISDEVRRWGTPRQQEYIDAYNEYGSGRKAGAAIGVAHQTILRPIQAVKKKASDSSNSLIDEACEAGGVQRVSDLRHGWKIIKDSDGNGYSLFFRNPFANEELDFMEMIKQASETNTKPPTVKKYSRTTQHQEKQRVCVVSLADVHFLKLCDTAETNYSYNREIARKRCIEGINRLLSEINLKTVSRFLFVLGNDLLHVDNPRNSTTAGTVQNVDGTIFQGFIDAKLAMIDCINILKKHAQVDLIHCMSNHDWVTGWALSQTISEHFRNDDNVSFNNYSISPRHRKYYKFGSNLLGFSHGDGAKEEKLYGLMVKDAREHISDSKHLYWFLHHVHHKVRNKRGPDSPYTIEKDHTGMTSINIGKPTIKEEEMIVEYVRTPSPPDGWHDRNGYNNQQAVECYIIDANEGMKTRHTEWF